MINGTFGSGKTSATNILQSLISNSMIYDPEEIGYMLRNIINEETRLEEERTDDFQDLELWRILTVKTAHELMNKYKKHLIVPMTIYKADHFEYILNGFKSFDQDVFHFVSLRLETQSKRELKDVVTILERGIRHIQRLVYLHFGIADFENILKRTI